MNNNTKIENNINNDKKDIRNINLIDNKNLDKKNFEINNIISCNYKNENTKTNEIKTNTEMMNRVVNPQIIEISNYTKALLLSINLGFLSPKKTFSLYISSQYLYKNIKKEIMLRKKLKELDEHYTKLNFFIINHVSI